MSVLAESDNHCAIKLYYPVVYKSGYKHKATISSHRATRSSTKAQLMWLHNILESTIDDLFSV